MPEGQIQSGGAEGSRRGVARRDTVASSNLASSSKFSPYQYDAEIFCYFRIAGGLIRFFNREVGGLPTGRGPPGTDASLNLASSSKKALKLQRFQGFSLCFHLQIICFGKLFGTCD